LPIDCERKEPKCDTAALDLNRKHDYSLCLISAVVTGADNVRQLTKYEEAMIIVAACDSMPIPCAP
jgi:hypothetical protein